MGSPKVPSENRQQPSYLCADHCKAGCHWSSLAFDFNISYVPGPSNRDADGLSRIPFEDIDISTVQAACHIDSAPFAHSLGIVGDHIDDQNLSSPFPQISHQEIRQEQNSDPILGVWMSAVRSGHCPQVYNTPNARKHGIMKKSFSKLSFKRGVLYKNDQLVLPQNICYQGL